MHVQKFFYVSRPLYLGIDASGVGLRDRVLHARDGVNYGHDNVPENTTMYPTALPATAYYVLTGATAT